MTSPDLSAVHTAATVELVPVHLTYDAAKAAVRLWLESLSGMA